MNGTMETNKIVTMQAACKSYGVRAETLRRWTDEGHIPSFRSPHGTRMFRSGDLQNFFNSTGNKVSKKRFIYCRVSSNKQRDDLERQINLLKEKYPNHSVIQDIGSGINFKRKGLETILEYAIRGEIEEIVVAHKDRLCRFGFEIFKFIIERTNGKIIILDEEEHKSNEQELAEDLLSIIHVFNCHQMGKRRYNKNKESEDLSNNRTEESD